jgi:hypothetical protein
LPRSHPSCLARRTDYEANRYVFSSEPSGNAVGIRSHSGITDAASLTRAGAASRFPVAQTPVSDSLPSWNDTGPKTAIFDFVGRVTKQGSPDLVPEAERIATFDNDGTLWAEQPMHSQLLFALYRVKVLAPQRPEWATEEPFASPLKGDVRGALAGAEPAMRKS